MSGALRLVGRTRRRVGVLPRQALPRGGGAALMAAIIPLCVLAGWQAASRLHLVSADLLPPPAAVLQALRAMAASGEMTANVAATARRVALGFAAGAAAATALGALTGASVRARRLIDPTVQALRSVPSIAWVPLFILWFGIFEGSKITLIALGAFFPIYLNLMAGIAGVDEKLLEVGRVLTLSRAQVLYTIQLPASLPAYLTGLRSGLGLSWMFVAAAELLGASEGLGYLLTDAEQTGRPERVLAAILLFALCGKLSDWLLLRTGAWLLPERGL